MHQILNQSHDSLIGMDGNSVDQCQRAVETWQLCETEYVKNDRVPCRIKKHLFLGSFGAAKNKAALKSENVTHILTVGSYLAPPYPRDFLYKIINVLDREDTNLAEHFDECFSFIDEARSMGGGVLVHCFAGVSRSVTIVVAYLMKKYSMSLSEALEYVEGVRPIVCPNSGFMKLLQNFGKSLQDCKTSKTRKNQQPWSKSAKRSQDQRAKKKTPKKEIVTSRSGSKEGGSAVAPPQFLTLCLDFAR